MSEPYNPFNPYGAELRHVTYLETFNLTALRPAEGKVFDRESAEYKHNAEKTLEISKAFRAAAKKAGLATHYPVGTAAHMDVGTYEIAVHRDDLPAIKGLLDGLAAEGLIGPVTEIPKEKSFQYALTKARVTPHAGNG